MTDLDLLLKRLAFIDTCLQQLRDLAKPDLLTTDIKERRFVEHTLQVALQAIQDIASHLVAEEKLGEPRTNSELLHLLAGAGWISADLAQRLRQAIGFRNVLVHGYTEVDLQILRDILANRSADLASFSAEIRKALKERG